MSKISKLVTSLLLLALAAAPPAVGQEETEEDAIQTLRQEIMELKAGQAAMRRQLAEIKSLVQRSGGQPQAAREPELPDVTIDLAGFPMMGEADAPITVVEFSDFQCPYCARHVQETLPKLKEEFVATGKIRYAAGDFPLPSHTEAFKGSVAAHCAGEQGKFWEMGHKIFEHYREINAETLPGYAEEVGLDVAKFEECFASGRHDEAINKRKAAGSSASVTGTPMFLLGYTDEDGTEFKPVEAIRGAHPFPEFERKIEELLAKKQEGM
jgi:protein-disulfide isomerase